MSTSAKRWLVLCFTAPIRGQPTAIDLEEVRAALGPDVAALKVVYCGLTPGEWDGRDLERAASMLRRRLRPFLHEMKEKHLDRIGIFAFGPIPLLALLGRMLGNKDGRIRIFQLHRPPHEPWTWQNLEDADQAYCVTPMDRTRADARVIALKVSISGKIHDEILPAPLMALDPVLYEIEVEEPSRTFLKTEAQLTAFNQAYQRLLDRIGNTHTGAARVHVFTAVPIPVAIELGRQPHPGVFAGLHVYEFVNQQFVPGVELFPRPREAVDFVTVPSGPGQERVLRLSEAPITHAQWEACRQAMPDSGLSARPSVEDPSMPVVGVSWLEALRFANVQSRRDGRQPAYVENGEGGLAPTGGNGYRLPTSSEWDLAVRASSDLGETGPFAETSGGRPAPTREGRPSGIGIYDLLGNVWEWCMDPKDAATPGDLRLSDLTSRRVVRGGGCDIEECLVGLETRSHAGPGGNGTLGFRLVG